MRRNVLYGFLLLTLLLGGFYSLSVNKQTLTAVLSNELAEGTHLGFIRALEKHDEKTVIRFDDAVWLSGKEGEDAAISAGVCTETTRAECLPNDYYIFNQKKSDILLILDSKIQIIMKTWEAGDQGIMDKEISLTDFALLINDQKAHWKQLPYTITNTKEGIIRIAEVYIP